MYMDKSAPEYNPYLGIFFGYNGDQSLMFLILSYIYAVYENGIVSLVGFCYMFLCNQVRCVNF